MNLKADKEEILKIFNTICFHSLIRDQRHTQARVHLFSVLSFSPFLDPLKASFFSFSVSFETECSRTIVSFSSANTPLFRDEIEVSGGAAAGTHKSSQKPQEPSLLGVITGHGVSSQGVRLSKARAPLVSVCVRA